MAVRAVISQILLQMVFFIRILKRSTSFSLKEFVSYLFFLQTTFCWLTNILSCFYALKSSLFWITSPTWSFNALCPAHVVQSVQRQHHKAIQVNSLVFAPHIETGGGGFVSSCLLWWSKTFKLQFGLDLDIFHELSRNHFVV